MKGSGPTLGPWVAPHPTEEPSGATHRDRLASLQGEPRGEAVGDDGVVPVLPLDLPVPYRLVLRQRKQQPSDPAASSPPCPGSPPAPGG